MKIVKITSGIYGYQPDGARRPRPVRAGDTVEVSDEEAARLVEIRVGVIVGSSGVGEKQPPAPVATPPVDGSGALTGENPPDGGSAAEDQGNGGNDDEAVLDIVDGHFTKESLMKMTRTNMEKLADDLGVDVKKCKTKSDIADLLVAVEIPDDGDGNPPVINPEGPVT